MRKPRLRLFYPVATLLGALVLLLTSGQAVSAVIQRTITIDGDLTDWGAGFPLPGDPAIVSVGTQTGNAGQFAVDAGGDSATCPGSGDRDAYDTGEFSGSCDGLQSVGRDLRSFAFTFDSDDIYLFVERFASASNKTDWWFYIDVDDDGLMESTDVVYHVEWQGSNQSTKRYTWAYTPANGLGDSLTGGNDNVADGYDMPGTIGGKTLINEVSGGSGDGLSMETLISWDLICGTNCPPQSVRFHISSSNGSNLPNNVIDNMDGPGAGGSAIIVLDIGLAKSTNANTVTGGSGAPTFTYTLTVTNNGGGDATGLEVTDLINPAIFEIVSDTPDQGTYSGGTGVWDVGQLNEFASTSLAIVVRPIGPANEPTGYDNTAIITSLNEADTNAANDTALVNVQIVNVDLALGKTHAGIFAVGLDGSYTVDVQNVGAGAHHGEITVTDTLPASFTLVSGTGVDWLCSPPVGLVFSCVYGTPATILAAGVSVPPLTLVVTPSIDGAFANSAVVSVAPGLTEVVTGNNSANDATTVLAIAVIADVEVTKVVSNAAPAEFDAMSYTVTAKNLGPSTATGLVIKDLLPAGVTYTGHSGPGTYVAGTGLWTIGTLTSGAIAQLVLDVTIDAGTGGVVITNTAVLDAMNELDNVAANNTASVDLIPMSHSLITSTVTVSDNNGGLVNPGDTLTYTITLVDTGGLTANNVIVSGTCPLTQVRSRLLRCRGAQLTRAGR